MLHNDSLILLKLELFFLKDRRNSDIILVFTILKGLIIINPHSLFQLYVDSRLRGHTLTTESQHSRLN